LEGSAAPAEGRRSELPLSDGRDGAVMEIISRERLDQFSFDGLRRRSGLHQETLSRILDRLEDQGYLSKSSQGYVVTRVTGSTASVDGDESAGVVPLLQTLLPEDLGLIEMTAALRGRWFGSLRWLGMSRDGDRQVLKWISEDGGIQVDADFSPGILEVTASIRQGRNLVDAIKASYELMGHLTRVYAKLRPRKRLSFFLVGRSPLSN